MPLHPSSDPRARLVPSLASRSTALLSGRQEWRSPNLISRRSRSVPNTLEAILCVRAEPLDARQALAVRKVLWKKPSGRQAPSTIATDSSCLRGTKTLIKRRKETTATASSHMVAQMTMAATTQAAMMKKMRRSSLNMMIKRSTLPPRDCHQSTSTLLGSSITLRPRPTAKPQLRFRRQI